MEAKKLKAYELFVYGMSIAKASKEVGIDERTLSRYLKSKGVDTKRNSRKHIYDESYFKIIDTEEKAYWLGFIYADGCVRANQGNMKNKGLGLEITLQELDKEHLFKFAKCLKLDESVVKKRASKSNEKCYNSYRITLTSTKMCNYLINKGVTLRKSLTLEFPSTEIINEELQRHFIRGYFDGDGNIGLRNTQRYKNCPRVTLLGTENFLNDTKNLFEDILNVTNVKLQLKQNNKAFSYQKSGNDARKILRYMYDGASIYLDRKYKIYEQIFAVLDRNV
ncbi:hypothetical protein [Bacillus licheniformis]|uniref:hypothetical protein n=1 Tax=Bacillus licheniformis TaxID=1402 RepID=UPI00237CCAF8|nr:hypothetical protein [Bacillus licheniformis]MDE1406996.1 hypothetical protein [Bacillus licheniformis]